MGYQICPLCKGKGFRNPMIDNPLAIPCTVCQGQKIINEYTGKPPTSTDSVSLPKVEDDIAKLEKMKNALSGWQHQRFINNDEDIYNG